MGGSGFLGGFQKLVLVLTLSKIGCFLVISEGLVVIFECDIGSNEDCIISYYTE